MEKQNKLIFTLDRGFDGSRLEMTIDADNTWPEVLDEFVNFLRGCGYIIDEEDLADKFTPIDLSWKIAEAVGCEFCSPDLLHEENCEGSSAWKNEPYNRVPEIWNEPEIEEESTPVAWRWANARADASDPFYYESDDGSEKPMHWNPLFDYKALNNAYERGFRDSMLREACGYPDGDECDYGLHENPDTCGPGYGRS